MVIDGSGADARPMEFVATSATQWMCMSGGSSDLLNVTYNFAASFTMYRIGSTDDRWDFRFPWFLVSLGAVSVTQGTGTLRDFIWVASDDIRTLTQSLTGASTTFGSGKQRDYEVPGVGADNQTAIVRTLFLGRGPISNNRARVYAGTRDAAEDVWPLRIRGHS